MKQILSIPDDTTFGHHKQKVAVIHRNPLRINITLYNSEVWYSTTVSEIQQLEQIDERVLRGALSVPCNTPRPLLYLELGCLPIRFIIQNRRLMFLHYILQQDTS